MEERQKESSDLRREIGLFGGVSILGGIMIGSGIFYIGGIVLERVNLDPGLALLVWVCGGMVTLMSGICFAELGAMMPKAGGSYVYLKEAYGEKVAFMSGFSGFILGSSGSNAALAIAFSSAVSSFIFLDDLMIKVLATFMIVFLTAINILGVKVGSRLQNIFMVLKLLPLFAILIGGLLLGEQEVSLVPTSFGEVSILQILSMIAFGVVATMWAFEGWTNLNGIAEEIKKPERNLPRAIIISIVGITGLYALFNYAIFKVLPFDTITSLISGQDYYLGTYSAQILFGNAGATIVSIAMILAIFSSLNGCIMVFPRTYYAMAKDGAFFKGLAHINDRFHTPDNALVVSAIVSIVLVWMRDLSQLTSLVALCGMIFNTLIFISVIILRKKYPTMHRPYKVWAYPIMIILIVIIMMGLMINTFIEDPTTAIIGLSVPLIGLLIYHLLFERQVHDLKMKGATNESSYN